MRSPCKKAEMIEVIKLRVVKGNGNDVNDPIKEKVQYWSKDGIFLFEEDENS
ncbi:hypothetical protein [Salipaludibacillus sp. CF4.18]|uniref:hypothetical protein n=1 Tax=Salipaludibacillus sp. CF4.18 TaxID=3373081 RepID=UPI003EE44FE2